MRISALVIAALITLAGSSICSAEPLRTGGYMSGYIGANFPEDIDVTSEQYTPTFRSFSDKVEFDPGVNVGMTGGYNFGYFRLEGELSYKGASLDNITDKFDNYQYRSVDGDISVFAMLLNGFFDLRNDSPVTPYFGGGIGFATVYLDDTYATNTRGGITTRDHLYFENSGTAFAYQVGGGLEIAINRVLSLDLGYRYFGTANVELDDDNYYDSYYNNYLDNRTELKFKSHNASVGFRIKF